MGWREDAVLLMTGRHEPGGLASGQAAKIGYNNGPRALVILRTLP
jgi:hypothetical protein